MDIKKELEAAHRELAQATVPFAHMLATRRLNVARIEAATLQVNNAAAALNKLLERLKASV